MALSAISPSGVASAWIYPRQTKTTGRGLTGVLQADPGFTNPPVIFEPPYPLSAGEYLLWIIATGASPDWGGCAVYASVDNTTYQLIGTIYSGGIQGVLSAAFASGSDPDTSHTLSVDLTESQGKLIAGTVTDADDSLTLCYCDGELIAYSAATLTSAYHYDLATYIRRGCYNTVIAAHLGGTDFARVLGTTFSQRYLPNLVGKTVYFKFASFNTFFANAQDLSVCVAYPYTLTGIGVQNASSWYQAFSVGGAFAQMAIDAWDGNYEVFDVLAPVALAFPANFSTSPTPGCEVAPTGNVTLTFQTIHNGTPTTVGTMTVLSGHTTGSYSCSAFTVPRGDRLRLYAPSTVNAAIVGLFGTIVASRSSVTAVPVVTLTAVSGFGPPLKIPDTTPLGTVLATFSVVMSDGSPFTGTVAFGAPYYDDGGIFSISGSSIEVNPSGPGIANTNITTVDNFTLVATP